MSSAPVRGDTSAGPRYFERLDERDLGPRAARPPVCLYLETTNRCNLLCQTCPRTFASTEKPADLTFDRLKFLVDQIADLQVAVLHGIGEPTMNRELPRMVRYLAERGVHVVFNSNGTLLRGKLGRSLVEARLDEIRISLDAADAATFERVRGLPLFDRILNNLRAFNALKREMGAERPKLSLWLVGLRETIESLVAFVELAHDLEIPEVYLQRLVYFDQPHAGWGVAQAEQSLHGAENASLRAAEARARELGVRLVASGATTPEESFAPTAGERPWSLCRRPWTLMYITANGNALPCCIAPFVDHDYSALVLGNAFETPLAEIFDGPRYQAFRRALASDTPERCCQGCGVRWSL